MADALPAIPEEHPDDEAVMRWQNQKALFVVLDDHSLSTHNVSVSVLNWCPCC